LISLPASLVSLLVSLLLALGPSFSPQGLPSSDFIDQYLVVGALDQVVDVFQRVISVRNIGGYHHEYRQKPHPVLSGLAKAFPVPPGRHQLDGGVPYDLKGGRHSGQLRHAGTLVEGLFQLSHGLY
jgi:hypothetical protein